MYSFATLIIFFSMTILQPHAEFWASNDDELPTNIERFIEASETAREVALKETEDANESLRVEQRMARAGRVDRSLREDQVLREVNDRGVPVYRYGSSEAKVETIQRLRSDFERTQQQLRTLHRNESIIVPHLTLFGGKRFPDSLRVGDIGRMEFNDQHAVKMKDRYRFLARQVIDGIPEQSSLCGEMGCSAHIR